MKHTGYLHFITLMNLLYLPTSVNCPQDIISHIQVVHRLQVKSMHSLIWVWFLNPFRLPSSQCEAYSQHLYKCQCCFIVDCILQILISSYPISLSFNQSLVAKNKKHFNQSTMSLLFYVILFYIIFLVSDAASVGTEQMSTGHLVPLYLPLSEFINTDGTI